MTNNSNLQTVVIRLAFRKGSDEIHAGLTKNNNVTLVGEILHSSDLTVSHYNKLFNVAGNSCVGSVGTVCISDREVADALIEEINSIQVARPVNNRGNKYPFVFLSLLTDGDIVFNKGVGGEAHRLSFLDVELVEVHADAPDEVVRIETPQVPTNTPRSAYGTVRYRRPQVQAARRSVEKVPTTSPKTTHLPSTNVDGASLRSQGGAVEPSSSFVGDGGSNSNVTDEEREILILGGISSKRIDVLSRERIDALVKALKLQVAAV